MLENTFIHLPSIGYGTEKRLWLDGIITLYDFIDKKIDTKCIVNDRYNKLCDLVHYSIEQLKCKNIKYFFNVLPTNESWRLYKYFQDNAIFMDIETTGLSYSDDITLVSLYYFSNNEIKTYIFNKSKKTIKDILTSNSLFITFNGSSFDIPFLQYKLNIKDTAIANIDLRYTFVKLGIKGGLKSIEKHYKIFNRNLFHNMRGYDPIILWNLYKKHHNHDALSALKYYNAIDTYNLFDLMNIAYNAIISKYYHQFNFDLIPHIDNSGVLNNYKLFNYEVLDLLQISHDYYSGDERFIENLDFEKYQHYFDSKWKYVFSNKHKQRDDKMGKWLIFNEDYFKHKKLWNIIKKETIDGNLGIAAKASFNHYKNIIFNNEVICIYTYDNKKDINNLYKLIRSLGIEDNIYYKSDQDTSNGIYSFHK